jgi:hypothetical protein
MKRTVLAAALLFVLIPGAARAGTYDVVACGSAGVNNSWTPSWSYIAGTAMPEAFQYRTTCDGGMFARTRTDTQQTIRWSNAGGLQFNAPAGTAITAVRLVRYAEARPSGDDPNTAEAEDGYWKVFAQTNDGTSIGGGFGPEQCSSAGGLCTTGVAGGSDTGVLRVAGASSVRWGVICDGVDVGRWCFANAGPGIGYYPLATALIYAATVTLEDTGKPALSTSGDMLAAGWRRGSDTLRWDASDASGIRTVQLLVDGVERARADQTCDSTRPVPCPPSPAGRFSLAGLPVGDGTHDVAIVATDAAGNSSSKTAKVALDANPPAVTLSRAAGHTIRVRLVDRASGVAGGGIEVRDSTGAPFRALPTTFRGNVMTATLDHGSAARIGIRVSAADAAGNAATGQLVEMTLSHVRRGRVSLGYNRGVTISGRIRTRDGVTVTGQPIEVEQTVRQTGAAPQLVQTLTTDARGRFSFRAAAGPSRRLRFTFPGGGDTLPRSRAASVLVRATSTIHVSPSTVTQGGRVRFSGRLGLRFARVPRGGKLVDLQAFDRGRWRTFATARARGSKGAWSSTYRFGKVPGRYRVRLRIRREAVFPYDLGYSRSVTVRVR